MPIKRRPFFFRDKADNMQEKELKNDKVFFSNLSLRLKVKVLDICWRTVVSYPTVSAATRTARCCRTAV